MRSCERRYQLEYHGKTVLPDKSCPNEKCARVFHYSCLLDMLRSNPTTKQSFNTLYGCCPYCQTPLSLNLGEGLFSRVCCQSPRLWGDRENAKQVLAWRNWIAHWTSNPEVVGSSPTVSFPFSFSLPLPAFFLLSRRMKGRENAFYEGSTPNPHSRGYSSKPFLVLLFSKPTSVRKDAFVGSFLCDKGTNAVDWCQSPQSW